RLADQLRREADVVARRAALESERLDLDDKIAVATKSVDQCLATIATLEDEWIELWLPTGIVPADPGSMSNWRHSYSELARVAGQATQLAAELADIELRVQVQSDDLRQALTSVGVEVAPETPLPSLLERCDAELKDLSNRQKSLELANSQLKDLVDQVQQLTILSGQAKESLGIWQEDWAKALGAIGQSGFSPKQAREFLKDAESLAREIDNLADFQKSVDDLRDAISSYEQRLGAVAGELGDPAQGVDSLLVLDRLISRLAKAKSAQQDVETLRDRMATNMVRLGTEQADLESTQDRLQQLLNEVSVETESDLHLAIENSDLLRSHAETVEGLETELAALSNGRSADELEAAIGDRDQSDLRMTISDLDERISGLQEELLTEKSALGGAETERRRWDGSAAAANAANEAQFALAEIGELTQEYLGLQMAAELLKEHIRIFRERHQTPILDRATPWFKRLTMGRFQRIETDEDSHGDLVLEAVRSNGERIKVEGLSEGTLDQLYLSLRLAALAEAAANGEPFPVILDDLLITFDDDRARAAFEVLGELSTTTQILVFTHHEHLRQIALEALGAKKLTCHDLIPLDSVPS
ncbi:MAG TPA: hypothetical protein VL068_08780, partial [Microthrixaceae bacterium]|nr:hypothetical protein [Microthrixaceae bacterium]